MAGTIKVSHQHNHKYVTIFALTLV